MFDTFTKKCTRNYTAAYTSTPVPKARFYLRNSADPDELHQYAAFHLGLHCLPKPSICLGVLYKENWLVLTQFKITYPLFWVSKGFEQNDRQNKCYCYNGKKFPEMCVL